MGPALRRPSSLPESFYAGGEGSVLGRKTKYNGEQEIYVDPGYEGRGMVPLGLDPFKVQDSVLSIVARRISSDLKEVLFSNGYLSGVLTTQKSFSQKYGYFEIRAMIPLGTGVWATCERWRLASRNRRDGGTRTTARRRGDDDALENSGHRAWARSRYDQGRTKITGRWGCHQTHPCCLWDLRSPRPRSHMRSKFGSCCHPCRRMSQISMARTKLHSTCEPAPAPELARRGSRTND
jgi:hypothetical protein